MYETEQLYTGSGQPFLIFHANLPAGLPAVALPAGRQGSEGMAGREAKPDNGLG